LRHAVLRDIALVDVVLHDADLQGATLERVSASSCDARRLFAVEARLASATFALCNLAGSMFDAAVIDGALFLVSNLAGASFGDAELAQVDFRGVRMPAAGVTLQTDLSAASIRTVRGGLASFSGVDLTLAQVSLGGGIGADENAFALVRLENAALDAADLEIDSTAARCVDWRGDAPFRVSAPACGRPLDPGRRQALERSRPAAPAIVSRRMQAQVAQLLPRPPTGAELLAEALAGTSEPPARLLGAACASNAGCDGYDSGFAAAAAQLPRVGSRLCGLLTPGPPAPERLLRLDPGGESAAADASFGADLLRLTPDERRSLLLDDDMTALTRTDPASIVRPALSRLSLLAMQSAIGIRPPDAKAIEHAVDEALAPCVAAPLRAEVVAAVMAGAKDFASPPPALKRPP